MAFLDKVYIRQGNITMDMEALKRFKEQIRRRPLFGPFCKTSDPGVIEAIGHAGFDFVILDMEHGPASVETIQHLVLAAEVAGIVPIVRVPAGNYEMISRVLDVGAAGVQVPQIATAQDVELAVQAAKFSPLGERGVCRFVRAARYSSMEVNAYFRQANEALLVIQLEGEAALRNLEAILDTGGPDVVFIGPYDLSQSLGVPGQVEHPLVFEKADQIVDACLKRGIVVGNFTETPEQTAIWTKRGLRYMSFSVDMGIVYETCRDLVSRLRGQ
jgi:4-hydroxy-2-oxoheptanedioate aldolase